jgi:hypothetical protein
MPPWSRDASERSVEGLAHGRGRRSRCADGAEADAVLEDLVALGDEKLFEEGHEGVDLVVGPAPVLFGEGVEGELLHPSLRAARTTRRTVWLPAR